jgi:hypothetical protein
MRRIGPLSRSMLCPLLLGTAKAVIASGDVAVHVPRPHSDSEPGTGRALANEEKALRHGKAPVPYDGLSYLGFVFGFIFPCAQRCFINRDSFLRAAALMRPRVRGMAAALGGRRALLRPVELRPSIAAIARSMRSRSARSSARMLAMSMMLPSARHSNSIQISSTTTATSNFE